MTEVELAQVLGFADCGGAYPPWPSLILAERAKREASAEGILKLRAAGHAVEAVLLGSTSSLPDAPGRRVN